LFLAVISVDRVYAAGIERNSTLIQDRWERYDAGRWSIDPVEGADPVDSDEPSNNENLADTHWGRRPSHSVGGTDTTLERSTYWRGVVKAINCLREIEKVLRKVACVSRPYVESKVASTPEICIERGRRRCKSLAKPCERIISTNGRVFGSTR
jgi:hypothetical protein